MLRLRRGRPHYSVASEKEMTKIQSCIQRMDHPDKDRVIEAAKAYMDDVLLVMGEQRWYTRVGNTNIRGKTS
jgi:hypothetical protein